MCSTAIACDVRERRAAREPDAGVIAGAGVGIDAKARPVTRPGRFPRCLGHLEIVNASDALDNAVAGVVPEVHAAKTIYPKGSCFLANPTSLQASWVRPARLGKMDAVGGGERAAIVSMVSAETLNRRS